MSGPATIEFSNLVGVGLPTRAFVSKDLCEQLRHAQAPSGGPLLESRRRCFIHFDGMGPCSHLNILARFREDDAGSHHLLDLGHAPAPPRQALGGSGGGGK